jgi:hypothetical protein
MTNTNQDFVEFRIKRNLTQGSNPESFIDDDSFITHQDRTMIAFRNAHATKRRNDFPFKF